MSSKAIDRPACYNREDFEAWVKVQTGWAHDGSRVTEWIPDPMSKECSSIKPPFGEAYLKNWACDGCRHDVGGLVDDEDYD